MPNPETTQRMTSLGRDIESVLEALASGASYAASDVTRQANEALTRIGTLAQKSHHYRDALMRIQDMEAFEFDQREVAREALENGN